MTLDEHLSDPCCQTLYGIKRHIAVLGLGEFGDLCFALKVDSEKECIVKMWEIIRGRSLRGERGAAVIPAPKRRAEPYRPLWRVKAGLF